VIVLLILLAVASIAGIVVGEFLPTGMYGAEEHYRARFGDATFAWLVRLGAFDPFRSYGFHSLLFLLAASLIACSVSRLRNTVRSALGVTFRRSPTELLSLKQHARLAFPAGAGPADPERVRRVLRRHGYAVRIEERQGLTALAAARGGLSRFGPYLTHLGLLCLIGGGMVSGLLGRSEQVWLAPGESWSDASRGFSIRLTDFEIPRNDRGEILQYQATVELQDPVRGNRAQVISVNHPLRHAGVSFYQSSYKALDDQVAWVTLRVGESPSPIRVPFRERTALPDGRRIEVQEFVADFRLSGGKVVSASHEMRNPAVKVALYSGAGGAATPVVSSTAGASSSPDTPSSSIWLFQLHPDFRHQGLPLSDLVLAGAEPRYATGLQARTSPGAGLIWAGFLVTTLGLLLSFYLTHRRLWVVVDAEAITLAGMTSGNRAAFMREFNSVAADFAGLAGRMAA
jgi:cytochrome c biogenesis protein